MQWNNKKKYFGFCKIIFIVGAFFLTIQASHARAYTFSFSDNFDSLATGTINGQNGWVAGGEGTWTIGAGGTSGTKILSQTSSSGINDFELNYVSNGTSDWTDQQMTVDFTAPNPSYSPQFWLRKTAATGDAGGYLIFYSAGTWSITEHASSSGMVFTTLATSSYPISNNTWYTASAQVVNNSNGNPVISLFIYPQGTSAPTSSVVSYVDTANTFQSGYIALGSAPSTGGAVISYDNLSVNYSEAPLVITSPSRSISASSTVATLAVTEENGTFYIPYIQTSPILSFTASVAATYVPSGGGVLFVLDQGTSYSQTVSSIGGSSPYRVNFLNVQKGTHTVDAYIINANNVIQVGYGTHDRETDIGIGDIITAIGDSITAGYPYSYTPASNWISAANAGDPISLDGRNYPQNDAAGTNYRIGYTVELNNVLSLYYKYPVFIMNEGWSAITSGGYVGLMTSSTNEWQNRETALAPNKWLIHLGVNDADGGVSTSSYAANLQSIITMLTTSYHASSSEIFVAKPSYIQNNPSANALEAMYLPVISNLIQQNNLSAGPDFYDYFAPYSSTLYSDSLHPNLPGYIEAGDLWALPLMKPENLQASQSGNNITLNWSNLSVSNSQINGYKVKYGTSTQQYSTTVDLGNVLSTTVTGLIPQQPYYFSVVGYYHDATSTTMNLTANATEVEGVVATIPNVQVAAGGEFYSSTSALNTSLPSTIVDSSQPVIANGSYSTIGVSKIQAMLNVLISQLQSLLTQAQQEGISLPYGSAEYLPTPTSSISYLFTKNLKALDSDIDVKMLQEFLNQKGFIIATFGPGSVNNESIKFGAKTWKELVAFQRSVGIFPASGFFGPITRAYVNAHERGIIFK